MGEIVIYMMQFQRFIAGTATLALVAAFCDERLAHFLGAFPSPASSLTLWIVFLCMAVAPHGIVLSLNRFGALVAMRERGLAHLLFGFLRVMTPAKTMSMNVCTPFTVTSALNALATTARAKGRITKFLLAYLALVGVKMFRTTIIAICFYTRWHAFKMLATIIADQRDSFTPGSLLAFPATINDAALRKLRRPTLDNIVAARVATC